MHLTVFNLFSFSDILTNKRKFMSNFESKERDSNLTKFMEFFDLVISL